MLSASVTQAGEDPTLSVDGVIESGVGGFRFPDGTEQITSAAALEARIQALEAQTEFLLFWPALTSTNGATSAADCGLHVQFDLGGGAVWGTIARDTLPPSVPGPIIGALRFAGNEGCSVGVIPVATEATDIVAISRGTCSFGDKAQNAATAGYAAAIIYNIGEAINFEGQLLMSMLIEGGAPFAIPTIAMNAKDGADLTLLDGFPMFIGGPAEFCPGFE